MPPVRSLKRKSKGPHPFASAWFTRWMPEHRSSRRLASHAPVLLTGLRAALAPVVVLLAVAWPKPAAFALCLVVAFVSDILDGVVARRLNMATPALRRLDSAADTVFYAACVFAAWHLYPDAIMQRLGPLGVLALLEVTRYAVDFAKFRREASYHMWSSKLWGIALFAGFFGLLVLGSSGTAVSLAVYVGIIADIEGLAITFVLPQWQSDVPSFVHALRARRKAGF
ncbi:MAG: CDP-alcohol phosphatidyltransferase family protein [Rhodanobacter sp.]